MIFATIKRVLRRRQVRKDILRIKEIPFSQLDRTARDYWARQFIAKCDEYKSLGGDLNKVDL
jgi:hypothetical protein